MSVKVIVPNFYYMCKNRLDFLLCKNAVCKQCFPVSRRVVDYLFLEV